MLNFKYHHHWIIQYYFILNYSKKKFNINININLELLL